MNEKNKTIYYLVMVFNQEICNDLEQFIYDTDPSEIDGLYGYPNNAGNIYGSDLEVISYDIQKKGDRLACEIHVRQFYEVEYAYEDKEGDQIADGGAELYVYATVLIDCNSDFEKDLEKDYDLKIKDMNYEILK